MVSSRFHKLALVLLLGLGAGLFYFSAQENGRKVNTDFTRTDQGAYINAAIKVRESDFSYTHPRNRMPLYPTVLAAFMEKGATKESFFPRGKSINMAIALLGLVGVGAVFLVRFPLHHALNLILLAGFTVFLFKAAYVQAEVLYYLLTFAVFLLCWRLFRRPAVVPALLAGGLLGLAHLTKASVMPGILVMAVFYPLDALWMRWRSGVPAVRRWLVAGLVIGAFLLAVFPYISNSKKMFGSYFYNVNSTFYFWCDSWDEAKARTKDAGDRLGWPDLPAEEIPGLANYLRTHSPGEIVWRIVKGFSVVFNSMMNGDRYALGYGYLWICLGYLAFMGVLLVRSWRLIFRLWSRRPFPALAVLSLFGGYYLLIAWYSPIISGNRFILSLFLPFLFTLSAVIVPLARRWRWTWSGRRMNALSSFNALASIAIGFVVGWNCLYQVSRMYGGN